MSAETDMNRNRLKERPSIIYLNQEVDLGCVITFVDYQRNEAAGSLGLNDVAKGLADLTSVNQNAMPTNSIVFPLPKQLLDNISISAQGKELNVTGAGAAALAAGAAVSDNLMADAMNAFKELSGSLEKAGAGFVKDIISGGGGGAGAVSASNTVKYLSRAGLGSLSPGIGAGIDVAAGNTVNPYQALTFDGVALKQHTLNFEFAPETAEQSENLAKAIRQLQYNSLPSYAGVLGSGVGFLSRGLLRYPSIMRVAFFGLDDRFYYKFKPAMLSNVSVDYTPHGNAILRGVSGGRPAFVNITLTFVEQAIWTQDDVDYFDLSDLRTPAGTVDKEETGG